MSTADVPEREPLTPLDEVVSDNGFKEESVQERLQKARTRVAENHTRDIDIPGYNGELFCRYRLLESKDLKSISDHIVQTIRDREEQMIAAACDTLIKACDEFWVRDSGREIPVRELLDPPRPDFPVRYDVYLADFLGYKDTLGDPPFNRSVVLGLFGGNDIAVAAHVNSFSAWNMGRSSELDMILGET